MGSCDGITCIGCVRRFTSSLRDLNAQSRKPFVIIIAQDESLTAQLPAAKIIALSIEFTRSDLQPSDLNCDKIRCLGSSLITEQWAPSEMKDTSTS
jgi:hypothetical protein